MQSKTIHAKPASNRTRRNDLPPDDDLGQNLWTLVLDKITRMTASIDRGDRGRRQRFSFKRLESVLKFHPEDFDDEMMFEQWLADEFYPLMKKMRVEKRLAIETLRENIGHLSKWMTEFGVDVYIIERFREYTSRKSGLLWRQLVKDGGKRADIKHHLGTEDVKHLIRKANALVIEPNLLVSTNMKYKKKNSEDTARYRVANRNITLNLRAALYLSIIATKRPNEILSIRRDQIDENQVTLECSKVYRNGEETTYAMWPEFWPAIKELLDSHDRNTLFSLNQVSLSNWFKSFMVHCGFNHHWCNLHRMRSFSADLLVMGEADLNEIMTHGDWKNVSSARNYMSNHSRQIQLHRASMKKYMVAKGVDLVPSPPPTETDLMLDFILDINYSAHHDDGTWMTLVDDGNETISEFLSRTGSATMFGLNPDGTPEVADAGLSSFLSLKKVDVTRFELVASTMPR